MAKLKKILSSREAILKSEGFQEIISVLEANHPVHKGLAVEATLEQRALKQVRDEQYEQQLSYLRQLVSTSRSNSVESTYEEQLKK